jgi:hypothetical protein
VHGVEAQPQQLADLAGPEDLAGKFPLGVQGDAGCWCGRTAAARSGPRGRSR